MKCKKDTHHDRWIRIAKQFGISVLDIHHARRAYDTVWCIGWLSMIVEFKTGDARFQKTQISDARTKVRNGKVAVVRNDGDAMRLAIWMRDASSALSTHQWRNPFPVETI